MRRARGLSSPVACGTSCTALRQRLNRRFGLPRIVECLRERHEHRITVRIPPPEILVVREIGRTRELRFRRRIQRGSDRGELTLERRVERGLQLRRVLHPAAF